MQAITRELSSILVFMEKLGEVDVAGVEAMTSVSPMQLERRDDQVKPGVGRDGILENAPQVRAGFFVVPKVVE